MGDLLVSWAAVVSDIGGNPANIIGYKVMDMRSDPVEVANVQAPLVQQLLVDYVDDLSGLYPVAVLAYNSAGDGALSETVTPVPPQLVPHQVMGVTAVIVPRSEP